MNFDPQGTCTQGLCVAKATFFFPRPTLAPAFTVACTDLATTSSFLHSIMRFDSLPHTLIKGFACVGSYKTKRLCASCLPFLPFLCSLLTSIPGFLCLLDTLYVLQSVFKQSGAAQGNPSPISFATAAATFARTPNGPVRLAMSRNSSEFLFSSF